MNKRENVFDGQQTLIAMFFKLTSDIAVEVDRLLKENQYLRKLLQDFQLARQNNVDSNKITSRRVCK